MEAEQWQAFSATVWPERSGVGLNELLGLAAWPGNLNLAVLHHAIPKIQVDQALVGNSGVIGHVLEVVHYVLRKAHRHGLL